MGGLDKVGLQGNSGIGHAMLTRYLENVRPESQVSGYLGWKRSSKMTPISILLFREISCRSMISGIHSKISH